MAEEPELPLARRRRDPSSTGTQEHRLGALAEADRVAARVAVDERLENNRRFRAVQSIVMFVGMVAAVAVLVEKTGIGVSVYGVAALACLTVKLVLAVHYRPATGDPSLAGSVAAVVPFYNEDPAALEACLRSILEQSRPVDRIYVIDDGSDEPDCLIAALQLLNAAGHPGAIVYRLESNMGKRHAQAWAFARLRTDIVLTVDSDTVLDPHAVREGLRPFTDPTVQAVTGNVQAHNAATNLLTRLTSLRYANAFLWERAAYSSVGSVLCACGSFSLWRRSLIDDHLEDYTRQTFFGIPVMYGDDRRLTNYALTRGRVVFQDTAIAYTTVPERFRHYANQQLRWNKSFFRETLWVLKRFRPWNRVWLLSFSEIALWLYFTFALIIGHVAIPLVSGNLPSPWYLAFMAVMAYARSVRYLGSQRTSLPSQIAVYLLAPIYGLLYILVLTPIRLHALTSLRNPAWGTRARVEVLWADPRAASALAPA
jgi:hyaluronan synthase